MSFTPLATGAIATGQPTSSPTFTTIKNDLDDLDARTTTLEAAAVNVRPLEFFIGGLYSRWPTPNTNLLIERVTYNITLTGCRLLIKKAGSSSTTQIDIQKSSDNGSTWASIFSTKPSVDSSSGDYGISTNAVLSTTALVTGDLLRFDISSAQVDGDSFLVQLAYRNT